MNLHGNALLGPKGREVMVLRVIEEGWRVIDAAEAAGVSARTCSKWLGRYRSLGRAGLSDRPSTPRVVANKTSPEREKLIGQLRALRFTAPELSELLGMPCSTVSAVLKRLGMGRLGRLGLEPAVRYERERPGELIHIDVKKLGRIEGGAGKRITGAGGRNGSPRKRDRSGIDRGTRGWDAVHIAIDDYSRLAYAEVLPDEKATTAIGFLHRALKFYERHGITVEQVMTDNGSPYISTAHKIACRTHRIRHLRTRPYRPQTNGKAERFIRTMLGGWAYGQIYRNSTERTTALDGWLWYYNHARPHQATGRQPPITRVNNPPRTYN